MDLKFQRCLPHVLPKLSNPAASSRVALYPSADKRIGGRTEWTGCLGVDKPADQKAALFEKGEVVGRIKTSVLPYYQTNFTWCARTADEILNDFDPQSVGNQSHILLAVRHVTRPVPSPDRTPCRAT